MLRTKEPVPLFLSETTGHEKETRTSAGFMRTIFPIDCLHGLRGTGVAATSLSLGCRLDQAKSLDDVKHGFQVR
ncbi:MAG: hypothetical protein KJ587_13270 [Alphaproteobacteria bacterium]|nr:hypothetical protein [Alphaproteobacteria bacterium]